MSTKKTEIEPLIRAARKAYRGTNQHRLDELLKRRAKWQAKATRYQNLVERSDQELRDWLCQLVLRCATERAEVLEFLECADGNPAEALPLLRKLGGINPL